MSYDLTLTVVTASGDRDQPEASRCGFSTAAQVEREAALLWGDLPAWCEYPPVLSASLHPWLRKAWVVLVAHVWPSAHAHTQSCGLSGAFFYPCSSGWQHLIHGGACGRARGAFGAFGVFWVFGSILCQWGWRNAELSNARYANEELNPYYRTHNTPTFLTTPVWPEALRDLWIYVNEVSGMNYAIKEYPCSANLEYIQGKCRLVCQEDSSQQLWLLRECLGTDRQLRMKWTFPLGFNHRERS